MFLFWFDGVVWPGSTWGPHLINILLHVLNAALVWKLIGLLIQPGNGKQDKLTGQCAAVLFYGLHPLGVGATAWIAARFDVLSLTFGLAGMIFWLKLDIEGRLRNLLWMVCMLILSLLSKEQGIVFMGALFIMSAFRYNDKHHRGMHRAAMLLMANAVIIYIFYRVLVFGGLGGYLSARNGISLLPPFYYAAAILFPFLNIFAGWTFHWTLALGIALVGIAIWQLRGEKDARIVTDPVRILAPVLVLLFGLATTLPNPGLIFSRVMDHAESRFALMPVAAAAILAGMALMHAAKSRYRVLIIAAIAVWSIAASWRTDNQLQSWHAAGETAQRIVETTIELAPDPGEGSTLIFLDIPRENGQYAYIFGIGLEEALQLKYGREDFRVIRFPTRDDLSNADPERDFVFHWNEIRGELERLHAEQ